MKQPSNKKQVIAPIAKPKAKKTPVSSNLNALPKKKINTSASKIQTTKAKTLTIKPENRKLKNSAPAAKKQINVSAPTVKTTESAKSNTAGAKVKITKAKSSASLKKDKVVKPQKVADKVRIKKPAKSVPAKKVSDAKSQSHTSAKKAISAKKVNKQNLHVKKDTVKTAKTITTAVSGKSKSLKSHTLSKTKKPIKFQTEVPAKKTLLKKNQPKKSEVKPNIVNTKLKTTEGKKSSKSNTSVEKNKIQKPISNTVIKTSNSRISKIPKVEDQKIVAVHLVKKLKISAGTVARNKKKIKRRESKLIVKAEQSIPTIPKPTPKKAKAISSAVFRGEKNKYDFTVFPLDAVFEDVPAIYIISRRIVDKSKKAHHALVCIGQTDSLLDELKKHKKDKRAKKFAANSISLLHEENENRRLKIETDLKAAHAIRCLYA